MYKFTHIDAFYQVARYVESVNADPQCPERNKIRTAVSYRGTVKLHGSNSGVACTKESLTPQSRSREITVSKDNYGFAAFVADASVTKAIRAIERSIREELQIADEATVVLYGEWIGPGLQRGVGINQLPTKQWVLFATKVSIGDDDAYIDAVPSLGDTYASNNIFSTADGPSWALSVDFSDAESKRAALELATQATREVEQRCPWAARFGVEGTGEGIVWVPTGNHWGNTSLFFKTKGEKHQVTKSRSKKPKLAPEVLQSIEAFVRFAVTENRLRQGIGAMEEMGHPLDVTSTGHFLKWLGQDVVRECALELEANGLEWKHVSKAVAKKGRGFFVDHIQQRALR